MGLLHNSFLELCQEYVDIIKDKNDKQLKLKKLSTEKNDFLTTHQEHVEELLEKLKSPRSEDRDSLEGQSDIETIQKSSPSNAEPDTISVEEENMKIQEAENIMATSSEVEINMKTKHETDEQEVDIISQEKTDSVPEDADEEEDINQNEENPKSKPFQFSDFANQSPTSVSPKLSESDDSDGDIEKAKNSIQSFQQELQDKQEECNDKEQLPERTEGDGGEPSEERNAPSKQSILTQFKKRKSLHTMPPKSTRKNPFIQKQQTSMSKKPVDPEIDKQRSKSLMKDFEAQMIIWNELVCLMLHLLAGLEDSEFEVRIMLIIQPLIIFQPHYCHGNNTFKSHF